MSLSNEETAAQVKRPRDPDMIGAEAAMHRAAKKARQRAFETIGALAVWKDGKMVWEKPDGTYTDELEYDPEAKKKH